MVLSLISVDRSKQKVLGKQNSDLLKAYFGGHGTVTEADSTRAQQIFSFMRNNEFYLVCDCERSDKHLHLNPTLAEARNSPLRVAALPGVLRAMPRNTNKAHHDHCVFSQGNASTSFVAPRVQRPIENNLAVFGPYATVQPPNKDTSAQRTSIRDSSTLPSISQVLFRIIEGAGLNRLDGVPVKGTPALRAYVNSRNLQLIPNFSLQNAIVTGDHLKAKEGISRIIMLKQKIAKANEWPVGLRPQGYWCGIVTKYQLDPLKDRYEVTVAGWQKPQYIEARPHVFGGYTHGGARTPFVAIFGYAMPDENSEQAFGMRCFMQPCLDRDSWFPVDSDYERTTLKILIEFQKAHPSFVIEIHKPLFEQQVDAVKKTHCKPDFVLDFVRNGKPFQVAIETMGYTDPNYEERKLRTHPLMFAKYGGLIQHSFKPGWNRELTDRFKDELLQYLLCGVQPQYLSLHNLE